MTYKVVLSNEAEKELGRLDNSIRKRIYQYMLSLETKENPKAKPLVENLKNLWRFRVGDYRLIAEIKDDKLIILMLCIAHRKNAYTVIKKRIH